MTGEASAVPPPSPPPWWVFHATGRAPGGELPELPEPPPWRTFPGGPLQPPPPEDDRAAERRLGRVQDGPQLRREEIDAVNAALLLRRPLLITGPPGVGKSTLAYLIARELGLGRVLPWSVVSRSTLKDGLYAYDAIGRAQAIAAWRAADAGVGAHGPTAGNAPGSAADATGEDPGESGPTGEGPPALGDFVTLGPLGTALLAYGRPRVLLVDELDKSDIDLPNDLLHVLENGSYEIPDELRDLALPDAGPEHLAEVMMGGLIDWDTGAEGGPDFADDIREALLATSTRTQLARTVGLLAELRSGQGHGARLRAALHDPVRTALPGAEPGARPWLRIELAVLRALAGPYAGRAARVATRLVGSSGGPSARPGQIDAEPMKNALNWAKLPPDSVVSAAC
ncbi:AAA family ATPase [Streptomyces anulatus]|uniref:AAA family ATPase n=1 Tax=Streptomyces anulatus TaxID=1892 RepID=UPI003870761D|nr:MoxR family ATPase [Streptomyces anulatus]